MTTQRAHVDDRAANTLIAVGKWVRRGQPPLGGSSCVPARLVVR